MYPLAFEDVHIEDSDKLVCRKCHVDYRDHYFSLLHPLSECYGNLHRRSTRAAELREAGLYVEPPPPFTVQVNSQDQDEEMGSVHSDDDDDDDSNGNDDDDDNQSLEVIIGPILEVPLNNQDAQRPPNEQGREQGGPEDPIDLSYDDSSAEELQLSELMLLRQFGREVAGYIADAEGIRTLHQGYSIGEI